MLSPFSLFFSYASARRSAAFDDARLAPDFQLDAEAAITMMAPLADAI